jgi:O-antigen/teichoic acid export membrane protein
MVLAAATLLNAISGVATATSLGVGRVWQPAAFAFGASAISLASNVALIPLYGINGAAFSFLLPQLIVAPLFVYVVTRTLAFPMLELLHYGFVRPIICASIQFLVLFFCREYVTSILALGLLCLASLCLYGLLSVFVAITSREREILFRTITSGVRKRSRNVLRNC